MRESARRGRVADGTAIGASALCLVHCLLLPLAIAFVPAVAGLVALPESVHLILFVLAVPISGFAIIAGFRRHGALLPGSVAICGLALIGIGALAGLPLFVETSVTVAGSLFLALAHIWNWRAPADRPWRDSSL